MPADPSTLRVRPLDDLGRATPGDLVRRWRRDRPLAALVSGGGGEIGRWSRWSILTAPVRTLAIGLDDPDPLGRLNEALERTRLASPPAGAAMGLPFVGGWLVGLGYELGRRLEPRAATRAGRVDPAWPWAVALWRCPWALVHDGVMGRWWLVDQGPEQRPTGDWGAVGPPALADVLSDQPEDAPLRVGVVHSETGRGAYVHAAARAVEYVHAGDVFQVNLAHRLGAVFEGSARGLWTRMAATARPWYGAYLETARGDNLHAALGVSPELFLTYDAPTRAATTRPIKGTIAAAIGPDAPARLRASAKDQAELNMIVDLMRNDLGRVCRAGSVRVGEARAIERHGGGSGGDAETRGGGDGETGVWHGVATVHGTLAEGRSLADLLRAAFPPGSITGAPKVRAMQIIEELEPSARGLYTGAVGYVSDCGSAAFNVAIRTAVVHGRRADPARRLDELAGGRLTYGVGAGIVADSDPEREWAETMDKAGALLHAVRPAGDRATRAAVGRPGEGVTS